MAWEKESQTLRRKLRDKLDAILEFMLNEQSLRKTLKYFPLSWAIVPVVMCLLIAFSTTSIDWSGVDVSERGWDLFVTTFKVPISLFALGIPIYGIILTLYRSRQSDREFNLSKTNVYLNNYYRHMDEFRRMIKEFVEFQTGSEPFLDYNPTLKRQVTALKSISHRDLYITWFGTKYETDYKIQYAIIETIHMLCIAATQFLSAVERESIEALNGIKPLLAKLGVGTLFTNVSPKEDLSFTFDLFHVVLGFSDQSLPEFETTRKLLKSR